MRKPSLTQKRSKYTNLPYVRSEQRKLNFGSNSLQRKPITLAKVNLKEYDDELIVRYIEPTESLKEDEIHSWGLIRFRDMTKEEFEKEFGIKLK